jgi:membrane protein implicated in regulation of membrane protease activity
MTTLLRVLAAIALDLLNILCYFAAVAVLTFALALLFPMSVALVVSLLAVSTWHGYRIACRIERARERGEHQ